MAWLRGVLEKEFIQKLIPSIKFIQIDVDMEILHDRFNERGKALREKMGLTREQIWKMDHPRAT